jgi:hypothetical protein
MLYTFDAASDKPAGLALCNSNNLDLRNNEGQPTDGAERCKHISFRFLHVGFMFKPSLKRRYRIGLALRVPS